MVWNELVKVALIGTDKSQLSPALIDALKEQGIDTNIENSKLILEAAALYAQMKKAGFQLEDSTEDLSTKIISKNDNVCSIRSIQHLQLILSGSYEAALPEFIHHMNKNGQSLPPELLPDIFDKCKTNKYLAESLTPIIGERGKWLIQQNPEWHYIYTVPTEETWEIGKSEERLHLLKLTRKNQPNKAINLLQSTWIQEDYNTKIRFLKILQDGLSISDEDFLESCLDDKRKEVRHQAAKLLASLVDSKLVNRMFDRVMQLVSIKKRLIKKEKLEIILPEELDDSMIRDGINPQVQNFSGGLKASHLGQMLSIIPPKKWEVYFKQSPGSILEIFVRSEWSELLIQALIIASARHNDEDWMETLLLFWSENYDKQRWQNINTDSILKVISADLFNKITFKCVKNSNTLLEENTPAVKLLKSSLHQWEDKLAIQVIQNLQTWMAGDNSKYWSAWHFKSILGQAAYLCNPQLHETLSSSWPENSRIWGSWEMEISAFLTTLHFRKVMIESLTPIKINT